MATKKAKQKKKLVEGETPITIGGGGGGARRVTAPLTIKYDPLVWVSSVPPGTLNLPDGHVKKIIITTGDFELRLPVNGGITIDLKCGKPLARGPKTSRR
jgi:hypothetical protein